MITTVKENSEEKNLVPCPFCGGENLDLQSYWNDHWHYIACLDCSARGGERLTKEDALEAWQDRSVRDIK